MPGPTHQQDCSSLRTSLTHQWTGTTHKTTIASQPADSGYPTVIHHQPWDHWAIVLIASRPTQASRHPRPIVSEIGLPTGVQHQLWGPEAEPQDSVLSASGPPLVRGPGFNHRSVGNSPRISWTLALTTSKPALVLGPPAVSQPAA